MSDDRSLTFRPSLAAALLLAGAVSAPAFAGQWGPFSPYAVPIDWLKNCLIYTTDTTVAGGLFRVPAGPNDVDTFSSNVCAVNNLALGGTLKVQVPEEADRAGTLYDVAVVSKNVNLERVTFTSDCAYDTTGSLVISPNAKIPCPTQLQTDLSGMPTNLDAVIPFQQGTPNMDDRLVDVGETLTLTPGQYGRITLRFNATLVLDGAGDYEVLSIGTENENFRSFIQVTQPGTNLMVKEYLLLGHRTMVNEENTARFRIYVEGTDNLQVFEDWSVSPVTSFNYRGDGTWNSCYVYSPNGTQSWRGIPKRQAGYTTQVFAQNFVQDQALRTEFVHPQDPDCFAPEFGCPCISQNDVPMICSDGAGQGDGSVRLQANNATEQTTSYLLFVPDGTSLPINATPNELLAAACLAIPSANLTFDPILKQSITATGLDWTTVQQACGSQNLVPVALGPFAPPNTAEEPALCYSFYLPQRLQVQNGSCEVISP